MLSGSSRNFLEIAPHLAIIPGVAISLAVLGVNLLGDAIRDLWDPRLQGTQ
jgi:ABC-type dipeptide/oligopeptide/nickel transport system permease subunit